jgi:hypothetical protein
MFISILLVWSVCLHIIIEKHKKAIVSGFRVLLFVDIVVDIIITITLFSTQNLACVTMEDDIDHTSLLECIEQAATTAAFECVEEEPEIINKASIVYNALANTLLESDIARSRSTADAFFYASGNSPWVPFNDSDDPIAIEEHALFDGMVQNFNRHVAPASTAPSGFNYFRDAWNYEVGQR